MLGVAYLDGKTPSVLVVRGTYGLMKVDAWTLRGGALQKIWRWTNERQPFKYQGQGQHSIKVGDIDGDGFDEILNGSIAIDNDGRTMWGTGMGHGDRFYLSDIDPDRPGLEVWYTIEDPHPQNGVSLWDAKSGTLLFGTKEPSRDNQIAGGLAGDIDPAFPGMEVWGDKFFFTSKGQIIPGPVPPQNELVWWDGDLLRELHSRGSISKWKGAELGRTEGTVHQVADLFGDWREEIVTFANGELRVYSTAIRGGGPPRHADAGCALSKRCDAPVHGLHARAHDELLTWGRGRASSAGDRGGNGRRPGRTGGISYMIR